jgi:hypothetical protein
MNQHTPGPWRTQGYVGVDAIWVTDENSNNQIAVVYGPKVTVGAEDNARLIAAAPELLEDCRTIKEFLGKLEDGTSPNDPLLELRRGFHSPLHAALDKALGKVEGHRG